jgi:hypothetical protein
MYPPELFEMSLSLKKLRASLDTSKLPDKQLKEHRARAVELGDECCMAIGWLLSRPEKAESSVGI